MRRRHRRAGRAPGDGGRARAADGAARRRRRGLGARGARDVDRRCPPGSADAGGGPPVRRRARRPRRHRRLRGRALAGPRLRARAREPAHLRPARHAGRAAAAGGRPGSAGGGAERLARLDRQPRPAAPSGRRQQPADRGRRRPARPVASRVAGRQHRHDRSVRGHQRARHGDHLGGGGSRQRARHRRRVAGRARPQPAAVGAAHVPRAGRPDRGRDRAQGRRSST